MAFEATDLKKLLLAVETLLIVGMIISIAINFGTDLGGWTLWGGLAAIFAVILGVGYVRYEPLYYIGFTGLFVSAGGLVARGAAMISGLA